VDLGKDGESTLCTTTASRHRRLDRAEGRAVSLGYTFTSVLVGKVKVLHHGQEQGSRLDQSQCHGAARTWKRISTPRGQGPDGESLAQEDKVSAFYAVFLSVLKLLVVAHGP
jgi:hypothetical protein